MYNYLCGKMSAPLATYPEVVQLDHIFTWKKKTPNFHNGSTSLYLKDLWIRALFPLIFLQVFSLLLLMTITLIGVKQNLEVI